MPYVLQRSSLKTETLVFSGSEGGFYGQINLGLLRAGVGSGEESVMEKGRENFMASKYLRPRVVEPRVFTAFSTRTIKSCREFSTKIGSRAKTEDTMRNAAIVPSSET